MRRMLFGAAIAGLAGFSALGPAPALASSGSAVVYYDKSSCTSALGSDAAGTVDITRDGKGIDVKISLTGTDWTSSMHGVVLFVLNSNGNCPSRFESLGKFSGTSGDFPASIPANRGGNAVTLVVCIGDPTGASPHFSGPVTLAG